MSNSLEYRYGGARALVELHEQHLREFLPVWREASGGECPLPESLDPDYASWDHILRHTLGCAAGYMRWMCEVLGLPDPGLAPAPALDRIAAEADGYLEHLLMGWRAPLAGVEEEAFYRPAYESRWGVPYCIDAMLEHAVLHPMRHTHQMRRWLAQAGGPGARA
ncbi:MAG: hypothetical protein H6830_05395 [Planctomycetes bacterium]|nr:hypothetical protein [Planctomycetota bacterium]MCB9909257.1 hypothetical protein [Planctomycetota bacterium]HPF13315.1 hypothetical protein [Planctomycetota bacterium]